MEAGGLSMIELISSMKKDALDQDKLVAIVADLLEKIVNRNDKMQVSTVPLLVFYIYRVTGLLFTACVTAGIIRG